MKRNLSLLTEKEHDLVVIGGGAFGVCVAWDAALRGLSVALVESGDFCQGTSANCFKIVHGGIRYLQHADLFRIRQSSRERNILLRVAPHLVEPLPIVLPTYGHGMQGKEVLKVALSLYDGLTFDRNKGIQDKKRQIPPGCFLTREETLTLFPGLEKKGLTGAAIIHDGHMYSPPRLALSFLRSAVEAGAVVANYVKATGVMRVKDRIEGILARDMLSQEEFEVRGKVTVNAAGPWAEEILRNFLGLDLSPSCSFSRDACFVVRRQLVGKYALAVKSRTSDPDAILRRGGRHLFVVPWRNYTLIGVWHVVYPGSPDEFTVTVQDLQHFLDEVNDAYPAFDLTLKDISNWNAGLVLFGENTPGAINLSYGKRSRIIDHSLTHGLERLITLIGVRYTTARYEAVNVVNLVCQKLHMKVHATQTDSTPIYGGKIGCFTEFLKQAMEERPSSVRVDSLSSLVRNHGSEYQRVLDLTEDPLILGDTIGRSHVLKAEILHAVREEMAVRLADVVMRRTDLGTGEYPGGPALEQCAEIMGRELGWTPARQENEVREMREAYPIR